MTRLILAMLAATSLAAPAFAEDGCIWADRIDGFTSAKRDSIVMTEGAQRYLAEFQGSCVGLDWAEDIAVVAHTQCLEAGDKITFRDTGNIAQHCLISKLTKIAPPAKS